MRLNLLQSENRFIVSPDRPDSPLKFAPLMFGDIRTVQLCVFDKAQNGSLYAVDVDSYEITLLVGPPNTRPSLGFWQLETATGTSPQIASRATKEEVATALGSAFGPVTVEGGEGSYIVTVDAVGIWALPTATFQGNTLSDVLVFQITPGTAETSAQYRIEVLEVAPARVIPADWAAGSTTPTNTLTLVSGRLWQLTLDPEAYGGFFTITVDGVTTAFISVLTGSLDIQIALCNAGRTAVVQPNGVGGFFILFLNTVAVASVGGNTVILPFQEGVLDLTSTGIRELLDGLQFAPVKLAVKLVKDGETVTAAIGDFMLQMPINQPATIEIDAPQMAGLTFAISDDQAYMHVYQNGTWLYDIPLNTPS